MLCKCFADDRLDDVGPSIVGFGCGGVGQPSLDLVCEPQQAFGDDRVDGGDGKGAALARSDSPKLKLVAYVNM